MQGLAPFWLEPHDTEVHFPDTSLALSEPDGLLAVGGDLSPKRLELAYKSGIFPWYNHDQPILWWSPNPRAVLFPHKFHLSKSLRKLIKKNPYEISFDRAFDKVIECCSQARKNEPSTWITMEMKHAYSEMHLLGHAHSVEAWHDDKLVGGLYGMAFGKVFFGESMFSRQANASKVAFALLMQQLIAWDFKLIDCQVSSEHLSRFGAEDIPRSEFVSLLKQHCDADPIDWRNGI
jgi:leucyl/phenylalanyl-tRNA--protein transferase